MTSKNLFFNLMRENTKRRLWTVTLITLIFFFLFPVWAALRISARLNPEAIAGSWEDSAVGLGIMKQKVLEEFIRWCSIQNAFLIFLMILFAVLCGISGFSYLHSRQKTDFYHSIPVKRETLFAVLYVNGILYTAVPYLINLLVASILIQIKTAISFPWTEVLGGFLLHMLFFILIYSFVVLAAVMTGNTLVSLLGTAVFFSWGPGMILLKFGYSTVYFKTFYEDNDLLGRLVTKSSPITWYFGSTLDGTGAGEKALWAAAISLIVIGIELILYKNRPSEAAGHAMAFIKSQSVIKFLLVVPFALSGSLIFYMLKGYDGWGVFGLLCGLLISYAVIEIIYNFDFRKMFAHRKQLLLCITVSAGVLAFFRFDWCGYDSYLPSADNVKSSGLYCYELDSDTLSSYLVEPQIEHISSLGTPYVNWSQKTRAELLQNMTLLNTEDVLEIARVGIQETKKNSSWNEPIVIEYRLKNGGIRYRSYMIDLTLIEQALDRTYNQKEYKNAVYPILNLSADEIAGINYQEYSDYRHVKLPNKEMKKKLLETYKLELSSLTAETRRKESPIAALQFKTNEIQEMIELVQKKGGDFSSFNWNYYYPVYPSFSKTIELLKQCGIEVGTFLNAETVEKIELQGSKSRTSEHGKENSFEQIKDERITLTITDKKQIDTLLNSSVSLELGCRNRLNPLATDIDMVAYVPKTKEESSEQKEDPLMESETGEDAKQYIEYRIALKRDQIPEFVKKELYIEEQ